MPLQLITDIVSLVLIGLGAVLVFSAAIGVVRFRDTMSRIHPITKPQTAGLILTIVGAIVRVVGHEDFFFAQRSDLGILAILIVFSFFTSSVTAQRLGRVSRREGLYADKAHMSVNEAPAERSTRKR